MPEVAAIRDAALRAGARCALVSGSGPAVFAVTESQREAALVAEGLKAGCELVHIGLATERGVELLRD
jgi:homoserine kinase